MTTDEQRRLWLDLLAHPGWVALETQIRDLIVRQVGSTDPAILDGMKRVLLWPRHHLQGCERASTPRPPAKEDGERGHDERTQI